MRFSSDSKLRLESHALAHKEAEKRREVKMILTALRQIHLVQEAFTPLAIPSNHAASLSSRGWSSGRARLELSPDVARHLLSISYLRC